MLICINYLRIFMSIFRNTKYIITGLDLIRFFSLCRGHLLCKIAIFPIFQFHLALAIAQFSLLLAGITLMIGVGRLSLTALPLINAL
jgi:hypothetical protein